MPTIEQCRPLLDFIKQPESRGDYDIVWLGIRKEHRPAAMVRKRLTQMTIAEVLAWQDSIDRLYNSEAAGAYQILEDTLRDIYRRAGCSASDLFDEATQDKLAMALLERRGLFSTCPAPRMRSGSQIVWRGNGRPCRSSPGRTAGAATTRATG